MNAVSSLAPLRAAYVAAFATTVAFGLAPPPNWGGARSDDPGSESPKPSLSPYYFLVPVALAPVAVKTRPWQTKKTRDDERSFHDEAMGTDFSGRWKLDRSENFDAYLESMNVSATHRRFATRATVEHKITRQALGKNRAAFEVCVVNRLGEKCEAFVVGADPIQSSDARGDPITKHVTWEDHTKRVLVTSVTSGAGENLVDKRKLISRDEMIMELISPSRVRAYRFFSRVNAAPP